MRKCQMCGNQLAKHQEKFCSKICLCKHNGQGNKRRTAIIQICPICEQEFIIQKCRLNKIKTCSNACKSERMKREIRERNNAANLSATSVSA